MKHILKLSHNTDLMALGTIVVGVPLIAVLASKLVFWPAILAVLMLLFDKNLPSVINPVGRSRITLTLAALVLWSGLSCLWSIDQIHSLLGVLRLLVCSSMISLLVGCAFLLNTKDKQQLTKWVGLSGWLSLTLAFTIMVSIWGYTTWCDELEYLQGRLNYFNRTVAVLLALSWSISASIGKPSRFSAKAAYLILTGSVCLIVPSSALFIAFLCGLGMYGLSHISLPMTKLVLLAFFFLYILLLPFIGITGAEISDVLPKLISNPTAEIHRIEVWNFSIGKVFENPLLGFGFDTSQKLPGGNDMVLLHTTPHGGAITGPLMPLHPHSAPIQIWLELGLPGLGISALLFYFIVSSISVHKSAAQGGRAALATITSCFVMAILSFDIWQGWWIFTLCSAAVVNISLTPQKTVNLTPK